MGGTEIVARLPPGPLMPTGSLPERRLRLGRTEAAVVRVLLAQRERSGKSGSRESLSLSQDELAQQLGLPCQTPAERQRAVWTLQQTIWRVNPKLATHDLVITSLHFLGLGAPRYAIFPMQEVWAVS